MSSAFPQKPYQSLLLQLNSIQYLGCEIMVLTNIHHVLTICYHGAKCFQSNPPLAPQESCAFSVQMKKRRPSKDPAHVHQPMRGASGIGPR